MTPSGFVAGYGVGTTTIPHTSPKIVPSPTVFEETTAR
jgi:hypothetical protein